MNNFIQTGNTLTLSAPYDVDAGDGLLVGSIFGVACSDAASAVDVETAVTGVYDLTKISAQAWTVGAKIYWDNTNKECTTTSTSNTLVGVAVKAAANPSSTGRVRLNGSF